MELVPSHKHCKVCGTSIPPEDTTCSKACAEKRAQSIRQRRLYNLLFYGSAAIVALLFLVALHP
jgi:predicted nucleic acid-binding Zn ribbon protein